MASITQKIPSYTSGISQQPDELKSPGQLREAKNVFPDVTHGLMKRPGSRLIGSALTAYNTNSKWFHYYRDENEQYIGQIQGSDGQIKIWRCSDGQAMSVTNNLTTTTKTGTYTRDTAGVISIAITAHGYSLGESIYLDFTGAAVDAVYEITSVVDPNNFKVKDNVTGAAITSTAVSAKSNYLIHLSDEDIQTLTLNDYTYITNRTKVTAMAAAPADRPHEAYISLQKVAYANQYGVNLYNDTSTTTVTTATRIKIDLIKSSNNYCHTDYSLRKRSQRLSDNTKCGEPGIATNHGDGGHTHPSTDPNQDSWQPNTATQIFSVSDGASLTDVGPPSDPDRTETYTIDVKASNGSSVNRGENLYFRVATIGQALPQMESTGDQDPPAIGYRSCRYTTTYDLLYGGQGWVKGDYFNFWMMGAWYECTIEEVSTSYQQANLGLIRPTPTPFHVETAITAESILGDIQDGILNAKKSDGSNSVFYGANADVQIIGNGIYLTDAASFNITSSAEDLLKVFTTEIDDVADLPSQCKHGYVVKVRNSEANEDDYYVKFVGENDRDGPGVWEECAQPGRAIAFNDATMPIQIKREATGTFTVSKVGWEDCLVGDTTTADNPSFIGSTINKLMFFRNRLVMLSDENVIMSQPGDFFNFWPKSAITYSATDNIDISCSSEYPAIVYDGIQVNQGLVLFTKNQQFMLTTDSDVLSPQTAKINAVSSYNFNYKTNPVSLGTTLAFLDNAGRYTRFFESAGITREGTPNVIEQSKVIAKKFPNDINLIANSRENSTIFFCTKGTKKIYGFRYYSVAEQRVQQAWFEWELMGDIQHIAMLDDALYAIVKNSSTYVMQKFSIKSDSGSYIVTDDNLTANDTTDDIDYRIHLDNAKSFAHSALTYVAVGDYTKFDHTVANYSGTGQLAVYAVSTGSDKEFNGSLVNVSTFSDSGTTKIKIPGNWTTADSNKAYNLILGYLFDMEVKFPTIYKLDNQGENRWRADLQSSLVIHRTKFSLGPTGVYDFTLERVGKPDYTETFESKQADAYYANTVDIENEQISTMPIYERNTTLNLTLKSTHPSPATLYSMTWEGEYSPRYYQRV